MSGSVNLDTVRVFKNCFCAILRYFALFVGFGARQCLPYLNRATALRFADRAEAYRAGM